MTTQSPERFQRLRLLGEGAMGVVYEAFDRDRNARVALKALKFRHGRAEAILRFKREYRALQDIHHRNLVGLGELIADGDEWYFTMELVDGQDFLSYVRPRAPMLSSGVRAVARVDDRPTGEAAEAPVRFERISSNSPPCVFDEARLRATLPQLASGIEALHAAGKVHRDVKPSNVRVTPEGRVVLLDFGLIAEAQQMESLDGDLAGTPAYMAPEQAKSPTSGPAADWYALGVVLYEALTGSLPFEGTPLQILIEKQGGIPTRPRVRAPDVPLDLDELCMALLDFNPASRATGARVARALRLGATTIDVTAAPSTVAHAAPFVGRRRELDALDGALSETSGGEPLCVLIDGESGIGKSCLVRRFAEQLGQRHARAVVLAGRCYEREQVPYKALDGVIDALARHLAALPEAAAADLLPPNAGPLVGVFPVLRRARRLALPVVEEDESRNPHDLRQRAFGALRDILVNLASRHPLVVAIDDLQWADADSFALLSEILRPPGAPALLLVATLRNTPVGDATTTFDPVGIADVEARLACAVRKIHLERLDAADARELASSLLASSAPHQDKQAAAIAREARGHPLFIDELARHAATLSDREIAPEDPDDTALLVRPTLDLEGAIRERIAKLGGPARDALTLVALAGSPLAQETVAHALAMDMDSFQRVATELRAAHLAQTSGARATDRIEPYHGRVRAAVVDGLSSAQRASHHARLALALEAGRNPDGDALSHHWQRAGDAARAAKYAALAAQQATRALAFDRAAACWERALELTPASDPRARTLRVKLAEALASAGRGALAAPVYQDAANGAEPAEALDLRRRAAEQFLRCGQFDEGIAAVREVLELVGLAYPRSPLHALLLLFWLRLVLRLRGARFRERDPSQIPAQDLLRIDICWSVAFALALSDHIYGAVFQARAMIFALAAGEAKRVARALATGAVYSATSGGAVSSRVDAQLAQARALAERTGDPEAIGYAIGNRGIASYLIGRFRRAVDETDEAAVIFTEKVPGAKWENATMRLFALNSLALMGDLKELCRRQPIYFRDAIDRGDVYASVSVRIGYANLAWLVRDDPARARADATDAMRVWSNEGCHLEHFYELLGLVNVDLYEGRAEEALARIGRIMPAMRRSLLTRVPSVRLRLLELRMRAAIAAAEQRRAGQKERLARASRDGEQLGRDQVAWAAPFTRVARATVASMQGDPERAAVLLREAIFGFEGADMALHAAAWRNRLAGLVGGSEGASLRAQSDAWMAAQGVANPSALVAMMAPGFSDAPHAR